ncbi:hypothetical protein ACFX2A_039208 [Malus domestica]
MRTICCLEKAWLSLLQGSSQNDGRRGQTFSKVLKREEVREIKILEVQEWSFYWWRFKCAVELNANLYKNLHLTELQESNRRLLSRKLSCSETTRADLRNQRSTCFFSRQHLSHAHSALRKLWAICRRFLVKHENFEVPATLLLPTRVKE